MFASSKAFLIWLSLSASAASMMVFCEAWMRSPLRAWPIHFSMAAMLAMLPWCPTHWLWMARAANRMLPCSATSRSAISLVIESGRYTVEAPMSHLH